jgi:DNA-binding Lrp family transcriptional regulator
VPIAFVLINAGIDSSDEILKGLRDVEGVKESYVVYGVYDVVAKIEADTMDKLKDIVTFGIRRLKDVRSSLTMIVIEDT